jgi:phosphoribosylaminoimidazole (AIR) synthetase
LIRKLVDLAGADAGTMVAGQPLFDRLPAPTRIYVRAMLALAQGRAGRTASRTSPAAALAGQRPAGAARRAAA